MITLIKLETGRSNQIRGAASKPFQLPKLEKRFTTRKEINFSDLSKEQRQQLKNY